MGTFREPKLDQEVGEDVQDLDSETQAAIAEGLAQSERGEGRPWEEVREELKARSWNGNSLLKF